MYKEHKAFTQTRAQSNPIWRYMDFHKFLNLVKTSSLYFAPLLSMGDEFEGTVFPETVEETKNFYMAQYGQSEEQATTNSQSLDFTIKNHLLPNQFISCWTVKEQECFPMWKLYAKDKYGIAIKTNFNSLCTAFNDEEKDIYIGDVQYDRSSQDWLKTGNAFRFALSKKVFYKEEDEMRCIIQSEDLSFRKNPLVRVNLNKLIQEVYITNASKENGYEKVIENIKKDNGLNFSIKIAGIRDNWL